jgi:hypothetical protein
MPFASARKMISKKTCGTSPPQLDRVTTKQLPLLTSKNVATSNELWSFTIELV